MQTTLTMNFANARIILPSPGAITWYKGQRVVVLGGDAENYAQPMIRVAFADGRVGIFKTTELGLRGEEIAAYLAATK